MTKLLTTAAAAILPACLLTTSALAGKADDTLNIAFTKEVEHIDPYFNTAREGLLLATAIWDELVYRDQETGEYKGVLATSWSWVDDKTLELKLREGVKFHNGEAFDADDVVYTLNYTVDPKNGIKATDRKSVV